MANNKRFIGRVLLLLMVMLVGFHDLHAKMRTDTLAFSFEGRKYSGLIDQPEQKTASATIVIVPGSGKTNIVAGNWFYSLRSKLTEQGFACAIWDKAGCGKSEGVFDGNQHVQNSADEVIAAITELKSKNIPGSNKIGLWGISRAGWICPLVIEQYPIAFWISVSGTDDKETFGYLLESNFLIEGRSETQTKLLVSEWMNGNEIFRKGGSFDEYQKATEHIRADSFYISISGSPYTMEGYERSQINVMKENRQYDKETGLRIYIPEFEKLLNKINCPVLALFGEKDSQVDWQKTITVYKKTIGKNPNANLTIKTFSDCNHSMLKSITGGFREKLTNSQPCTGYFETMLLWLHEKGFSN